MPESPFTKELRRASQAVYIAVDESVAHDLSVMLIASANRLDAAAAALREALDRVNVGPDATRSVLLRALEALDA